MAADQERADRIRLLKKENPQLKWRHIADHVGVELRSAQMWQETGAISYENAKKLAGLIDDPERDVDWIMRGPRTNTPSPFAGTDVVADEIAALRSEIEALHQQRSEEAQAVRELLELQSQVLRDIRDEQATLRDLIAEQQEIKAQTDELWPLMRAVLEVHPEAEAAPPAAPRPNAPAARKPAASTGTP